MHFASLNFKYLHLINYWLEKKNFNLCVCLYTSNLSFSSYSRIAQIIVLYVSVPCRIVLITLMYMCVCVCDYIIIIFHYNYNWQHNLRRSVTHLCIVTTTVLFSSPSLYARTSSCVHDTSCNTHVRHPLWSILEQKMTQNRNTLNVKIP